MKRVLLVLFMASAFMGAISQENGGITDDMLRQIRNSQKRSVADKAIFNAMASNPIDKIAVNYSNQKALDTSFNIETKKQSITNQNKSGRCWLFSGMNVLRSMYAQRTDSMEIEFSHDYLFFWDQFEKANLFLQGVIDCAKKPMDDTRVQFFFKNPINDGGTFCGVADLTEKYGLVPKDIMPDTYSAENTSKMSRLICSKLREQGLALREMVKNGKKKSEINNEKTKMLGVIYHLLTMAFGEPPTTFTYALKNSKGKTVVEAKEYTPQSFYKETIGEPLNGSFIMVMNDPRREYHKTYEVEYDRHTYDGHNWKYLNLPMEDIEEMAIASLKDGRKMYSSYDVAKQLDNTRGYCDTENYDYESLLGTTFPMTKAQRISTFDSGSTHAMTLTAVNLDSQGKPDRWKVENSWGATSGHKGYLIMSNRWLEEYMFRLVVDKKYVPAKLLEEFNQKPVMVMPEDPLFSNEDL